MVKIQKIQPTTTVSPSSTAARMGVVEVSAPNIQSILDPIADSLNTFGEAQANLYDTKWLNDYEFNTGMFINDNVNKILASGETPNLEKFTTEMTAYNEGVLSEAPERLKIAADGYFQSKFINSFNVLKDQANALTFLESEQTFNIWSNNILTDFENSLLQITMTAPNPMAAMESIHEVSGTTLTNALEGFAERYSSLYPFSDGKYNESTLKATELQLLKQVEVARINAINRSFYQGIDITNPLEVAAADEAAANFMNNYLKNKDNARGLNYEIFKQYQQDEYKEGRRTTIGENTIQDVLKETNSYLAQLRSVNTTKSIKAEGDKLQSNYNFVNTIENALTNVSDNEGQGSLFVTALGGTGEVQPYSYKEMEQYFIDQGVDVTPAKIQTLTDKNNAKFNALSVFRLGTTVLAGDDPFSNPDKKVSILIDQRMSEEDITLLGGKENIMSGYYNYVLSSFGFEDNVEFFERQNESNLTTITKIMQNEDFIPKGYSNWFNTLSTQTIVNTEESEVTALIDKRLPAFDVLTNGGALQPDGMSNDTFTFYSMLSQYRREGMSNQSITAIMKKNLDRPQSVNQEIEKQNQTYLTDVVLGNEKDLFVEAMVEISKAAYTDEGAKRKLVSMMSFRAGAGPIILPDDPARAAKFFGDFFDRNSGLMTKMIQQNTLTYFNAISTDSDSLDQKEQRFQQAIRYSLNNLNKGNYGNTQFMDNVAGSTYMFMPIEKEHKNIKSDNIEMALTAYAYNNISQILGDINHPMYESLTDQFTTKDNEVKIPSMEQIQTLIKNGNIYVVYREDGGSGRTANYDMVIANSGTGYLEPDNFDSLNKVSFDGAAFNPNEYTDGGTITMDSLTERLQQDFTQDFGPDITDQIEDTLISPVVIFFQNKFGDLNIPENYAKVLQELNGNPEFKLYRSFQNDFADQKFNTTEDRMTAYGFINEGMSRLLQTEQKTYDQNILDTTFDFVAKEYYNQPPITKAFLSKVLLDHPNINKKEFRKAVISADKEYFKNLYNSPELDPYFTFFFIPQIYQVNE